MTVINTNVGSLRARVAAQSAQTGMEKAMQRLSSGLRINQAADDAAGLAVATKMESQLRGINMAIRNSNDGISLVQTAESGMSEISNMVIRMRELAVQMHNGIYSVGDRANAQLEISALLDEVDKIANYTAFNGVKVLDGSYNSEIRAGNTNAEIIGVKIDRMSTDALGGVAITNESRMAMDSSANFVHSEARSEIDAEEGQVQISKDVFSQGFKDFVIGHGTGVYAISSTDDGRLFDVNQSTGIVTLKGGELDFDQAIDRNFDGIYEFSVTYSAGDESVTEHVKLTITDAAVKNAAVNSSTTNLQVSEAETVSFEVAGSHGILSDAFKEFVASDTGTGSFAKGGADQGTFALDSSTGQITMTTGVLDYENAGDADADNVYEFTIAYTHSNNKVFTETVVLTVDNNVIADVGSAATAQEVSITGRSNIRVSADNANAWDIDFSRAADQDLLSQGAKDFITRHAGATLGANEVYFRFDNLSGGLTNGALSGAVAATAATSLDASAQTVDFAMNSASGTLTVDLVLSNAADQSDSATEIFTETITIDVTQNGAAGTNSLVQGAGRTEQSGAQTSLTGRSDGEAVRLSMKDRTLFADLNRYSDANAGGSYAISSVTYDVDPAAGPAATTSTALSISGDQVTLAAGADAGRYSADVTYTDLDGNSFVQKIIYDTTTATQPARATVTQSSTNQTKDGVAQSVEIVGGKSTIQIEETLRATIKSTGMGAVLSDQLGSFAASYPKGTWSLTGADATSFEVDKNGDIKSNAIMDYEGKAQHNFNLVYTSGDHSYTEKIVLNVANSTVDDDNHIADLDISTQQGAKEAVAVLDTALNQITAAQAKLGSVQNRLQHNIDNLSSSSSLTEQAKGRITDADFALATSQLSKQQILSQAATSMLAQANQSKQSVLALLQ